MRCPLGHTICLSASFLFLSHALAREHLSIIDPCLFRSSLFFISLRYLISFSDKS
eukprot:gene10014-6992_t